MIPKESINILEQIYQTGFVNDLKICGTDKILDAIRDGIEALEKIDKYPWHDLRKDPEDLPKYTGMYCVALRYTDGDIFTTALPYHGRITFGGYYSYGHYEGKGELFAEVIKWREIEPAEE